MKVFYYLFLFKTVYKQDSKYNLVNSVIKKYPLASEVKNTQTLTHTHTHTHTQRVKTELQFCK